MDTIVEWELMNSPPLVVGEIACDVQAVWRRQGWGRGRIGALFMTDRRVLFCRTGAIGRRKHVESFPLSDIELAELFSSPRWARDRGAIVLHLRDGDGQRDIEFEDIDGGSIRAAELVEAINGQQRK